MPSYAEQYLRAKASAAHSKTALYRFEKGQSFPLDDFQVQACTSLEAGRSVLCAAPTGAGKTLVGEFAIFLAREKGMKAFYTTPIKALSNQKYQDLLAVYGPEQVGLLTGDTSINHDAPILVMTTEVLRNMLYADSAALKDLAYVVMDEVHYLADRTRGAVWEEVILHLPEHVDLVALSATISNAEEFGAWLDTVRGQTDLVVSEHRPVPLWQHVLYGHRLLDLFAPEGNQLGSDRSQKSQQQLPINPELRQLTARRPGAGSGSSRGFHRLGKGKRARERNLEPRQGRSECRPGRLSRPAMVRILDQAALLPAICFIFSRAGCDGAVRQCIDDDLRLTTDAQAQTIRAYIAQATASLDRADLAVLGFYEWQEGLVRGVAAHHAGLLPLFKEVVEALFSEGLIRVVFATETLALGINMPARSVVIEKLTKFNGHSHESLTPGEFTQLTGRAGRRGIDVEGHALVLWRPGLEASAVASLASKRTYPLNSSFKPTYNMSAHLIAQFGVEPSERILENSFAQFQADASVVGQAQRVKKNERVLAGYEQAMACHLADFSDYLILHERLLELDQREEKRKRRQNFSQLKSSLMDLLPGDIVRIPRGPQPGAALVLNRAQSLEKPRLSLLTEQGRVRTLDLRDLEGPLLPVSALKIPKRLSLKTAKERKDLASRMREALYRGDPARKGVGQKFAAYQPPSWEEERQNLKRAIAQHPCQGCSERDDHLRWAERWKKLNRDTEALRREIQKRTNTIAQVFGRITQLLGELGYVQGQGSERSLTPAGQTLRQIYGERDLLTSLALEQQLFRGLDPASTAALASALVFEGKREGVFGLSAYPDPLLAQSLDRLQGQWQRLTEAEGRHRLPFTEQPDLGMVWPVYRWAQGKNLAHALASSDLAAGDFVRWTKQVIDCLDQLAHLRGADPDFSGQCLAAIDLLRRGVVALSL